jgi:hypothetical protein
MRKISHLVARDVISCGWVGSQKGGHGTLKGVPTPDGGAEIIKEERTE